MANGARRCKVAGVGESATMVACHDCDLLHQVIALPSGGVARCSRCRAVLYVHHGSRGQDTSLALVIAGIILFVISCLFPILVFTLNGRVRVGTLLNGIDQLFQQGLWGLAVLVLLTSILVPMTELLGLLAILIPLRFNLRPWKPVLVLSLLQTISPWGMMDVYLLGVLVAYAKLSTMATVIPGLGLFAFAGQMLMVIGAMHAMDCHEIWRCLEDGDG